jgi:hypothetical protein
MMSSIFDKIADGASTITGRKLEGRTGAEPLYTDTSRVIYPGGETTTTHIGDVRGAKISSGGGQVGRGDLANLDPKLTIY